MIDPIPFAQLQEVVLPLVAVTNDAKWHEVGTAFVIAALDSKRALLLTAAHNLKAVHQLDGPPRHHPATPAVFLPRPQEWINLKTTHVYALLKSPSEMLVLEIASSWFNWGLDAALLLATIRPEQDATFAMHFPLDSRPIAVGTPVMAVGYPGMKATSTPEYEKNDFRAQIKLNLEYRRGTVVALRPHGDTIHKWPGFLLSCALDSGMSGGPVIDLSGDVPLVRGIVGGDLSETVGDATRGSGAQAFVSMLWPAMITKMRQTEITVVRPNQASLVLTDASLLEIVRAGIVDDRGRAHEHARFEELPEGGLRGFWL
jgi:trypsin-like peptidase